MYVTLTIDPGVYIPYAGFSYYHVKTIELDTELVELLRGEKSHLYTVNASEESLEWNNGKVLSTFCREPAWEKNADISVLVSFGPWYFASVF